MTKKSQPDDPAAVPKRDEDADYKPMLRGIVNTHCNYDGGKVEGNME